MQREATTRGPSTMAAEDRAEPLANPARARGIARWACVSGTAVPPSGRSHGALGWIRARLMASMKGKHDRETAAELDLQPGDQLLDVGCGSAKFLTLAPEPRAISEHDTREVKR